MEVRKEETGMIKAENLTKRFYDTVAVDHIHAEGCGGGVCSCIRAVDREQHTKQRFTKPV